MRASRYVRNVRHNWSCSFASLMHKTMCQLKKVVGGKHKPNIAWISVAAADTMCTQIWKRPQTNAKNSRFICVLRRLLIGRPLWHRNTSIIAGNRIEKLEFFRQNWTVFCCASIGICSKTRAPPTHIAHLKSMSNWAIIENGRHTTTKAHSIYKMQLFSGIIQIFIHKTSREKYIAANIAIQFIGKQWSQRVTAGLITCFD